MAKRNDSKKEFISLAGGVFIGLGLFIFTFTQQMLSIPQKTQSQQQSTVWEVTSIDTMKYSRDKAKSITRSEISLVVQHVASLHPTHIAIATPYDEEFYPTIKEWVDESRRYHLKVWFRGNFSGWEGWFDYPKFTDISQHHKLTKAFILRHPDLFEDGDIFTPTPQPENGGEGDPRGSNEKSVRFNRFLVNSYNNCINSMQQIHKHVQCGYFSMNADVAKQVLTSETVDKVGHIVVVDHYVANPRDMENTIDYLIQHFHAQIVVGEFGAPIPDLNGAMTEKEQADFVEKLLHVFYTHSENITGINYWTILDGSTALFNDDDSPRLVAQVLHGYYQPTFVRGVIKDTLGDLLTNTSVMTNDGFTSTTDFSGTYQIPLVSNSSSSLTIQHLGYQTVTIALSPNKDNSEEIVLEPLHPSLLYRVRVFLRKYFML